ncbi:MAG: ornithine carbamoyltransferase, partial [Acidimicrobiales bacterium]
GMTVHLAAPGGYELAGSDLQAARKLGGRVVAFDDPVRAVAGADALYTDVWISMGEEAEAASKRHAFAGFGIDERLLEAASPDAVVMHCLPAHRGEEISSEVLEGERSLVWQQAENKMHAARGLLWFLRNQAIEAR